MSSHDGQGLGVPQSHYPQFIPAQPVDSDAATVLGGSSGPGVYGTPSDSPGPYPQTGPNQTGPYHQPPPKSGRGLVLILILVAAFALVCAMIWVVTAQTGRDEPDPTPEPTITVDWPTPTPTPKPTPTTPAPTPTGPYKRERDPITEVEKQSYGYLFKGACVNNRPPDYEQPVPTVDCEQPHTDQVMGFVDLSDDQMNINDLLDFEMKVAQRCNSLKATLPVPEEFNRGVRATYPDADMWNDGVRLALCWVPVSNKTWVGSVLDGTARMI